MMLQEKNELTNESAVMTKSFFTSESVADGHPDKVADQVSDSILDACLTEDPYSKVAIETLITNGLLVLAGEITSTAKLDYEKIAKDTIRSIGYTDKAFGFDVNTCQTLLKITEQSPDIAIGVEEEGAGDQGIMFGYACDETDVLMPLPIMLAHNLVRGLKQARLAKTYPYIRPDGKSQVTVEYDEKGNPIRVDAIVVSVQHDEGVSLDQVHKDMMALTHTIIPAHLMDKDTKFFINPTGRFVIGGPQADTGLTGRKIIVDSYGGYARHGGGAFSGKDATKVDRSAAYGARYIAKNIVGAKLAKKCEIQLSYAIGVKDPLSIRIDTKGTGLMDEESLIKLVKEYFPLRPFDIIEHLDLRAPRYKKTAFGGHFGRNEEEFSWEKLNPSFVSRFN